LSFVEAKHKSDGQITFLFYRRACWRF